MARPNPQGDLGGPRLHRCNTGCCRQSLSLSRPTASTRERRSRSRTDSMPRLLPSEKGFLPTHDRRSASSCMLLTSMTDLLASNTNAAESYASIVVGTMARVNAVRRHKRSRGLPPCIGAKGKKIGSFHLHRPDDADRVPCTTVLSEVHAGRSSRCRCAETLRHHGVGTSSMPCSTARGEPRASGTTSSTVA